MNVGNQTSQAFVTSSCPFCDCSCQFVTFQNAPTVCNSSFFELIVVKTRCRNLIQLLHRFVCRFAISFNAFLLMTFHVIIPGDGYRVRFLPTQLTFSVALAEIRDTNIFLDSSTILFVQFAFMLSASQVHVVKKRCRFSEINLLQKKSGHCIS